ncbi:MAG: secretin N-terminal domain-containing protein [Planctomycetota bacterium]
MNRSPPIRTHAPMALMLAASWLITVVTWAQEPLSVTGEMVTLHCPEAVDLQIMVDYVGKALDVRFVYGEELKNQRVELRPSPIELSKAHLLKLLSSLLRVRDLAMVEESPGFYRIVRTEQTTQNVSAILERESPPDPQSLRLVTQVLSLPSGKMEGVTEKLSRYLSSPKAGMVPIPEKGVVIVTDYESRIALLRELLRVIDLGGAEMEVQSVPVVGIDPTVFAAQVSAILSETHRLRGSTAAPPSLRGDLVSGNIVVIGQPAQITEAKTLIERLMPSAKNLVTKTYAPRYLSVDRAQKLIDKVALAPGSGLIAPASVFSDSAGGRLFVTAESATQSAIEELLKREDHPVPETQRPLRIYRPKNRSSSELLITLTQLLGQGATLLPPTESANTESSNSTSSLGKDQRSPPSTPTVQVPPVPPSPESKNQNAARTPLRVEGVDFVLTEDAHTNAILAIGTREFHAQLETLIDDLDQRRPQVLIEMTLVAVTLSDTMDLGVELEALDLGDAWDYLVFSNFGLSTIDVSTGQRVLTPGVGSNGVLLGPDEVPILFRALATKGVARVISTPRILVSDNARGTLRNVDEAPFTSVNASDTVATTSFGGFESAGTTLSVTPHIAEGDHLTLEYELSFSNFTGGSSSTAVPPPRTTNSFTSRVEVPDGYTVITGGLAVDNKSDSKSEVPYLGRIPLLGKLFQNSTRKKNQTKIFAFIRPVILRDDEFADLKFLSLKDTEAAEVNSPRTIPGEPQWMK